VLSPDGVKPFEQGSGRLELAERIASDSNPLTARVFVNRVWGHCFGQPLVRTPSNFGQLGTRPTHPELLDHLTVRFMEEGWSLKRLLRRIALSATYRKASRGDAAQEKRDPDNRLLWRANRKRLNVETWRDSVLFASGQLDAKLGGAPVDGAASAEHRRRTLYTKISRRRGDAMLALFDFPRPTVSVGRRAQSTTALQQLFLLNDGFMRHSADAFAARVLDLPLDTDKDRLRAVYEILFSRLPTTDELATLLAFVTPDADETSPSNPWVLLAHTLFMSNEMRYVE